jgi:hypothetical protein
MLPTNPCFVVVVDDFDVVTGAEVVTVVDFDVVTVVGEDVVGEDMVGEDVVGEGNT